MVTRFWNYARNDLWRVRLADQGRGRSFLLRTLRIAVLAIRGFREDNCMLRASALTFFTLLSIVPLLAMSFGIAKGFGMEERVESLILQNLQGQEEVARKIIEFARTMLEETRGGFIAGVGVVLLIWAVIRMLSNIESSFNHIWGIKNERSFVRKFTDYLSFVAICPLLLIMSMSLDGAVKQLLTQIPIVASIYDHLPFALTPLSLLVICMMFGFIYQIMPNTRVQLSSALIAGIIAGSAFQFFQWVYLTFQVGAAKYGAIYGSFAALPLFLIWLQVSWVVMLIGAEICFSHQNVHTFEFEPDCLSVSRSYRNQLALYITWHLIQRFRRGNPPSSSEEISHALDIPVRLVRHLVYDLVEAGVLIRIDQDNNKNYSYHPARDSDGLSIKFVLDALNKQGSNDIPGIESAVLTELRSSLAQFENHVDTSSVNRLLKDIGQTPRLLTGKTSGDAAIEQ